jgi:hypothetical protein
MVILNAKRNGTRYSVECHSVSTGSRSKIGGERKEDRQWDESGEEVFKHCLIYDL